MIAGIMKCVFLSCLTCCCAPVMVYIALSNWIILLNFSRMLRCCEEYMVFLIFFFFSRFDYNSSVAVLAQDHWNDCISNTVAMVSL